VNKENPILWEYAKDALVVIGVAIWGSLGKAFAQNREKKKDLAFFSLSISDAFVASFCGIMAFILCRVLRLPDLAAAGVGGLAGWMGPEFVEHLIKFGVHFAKRRLGISDASKPTVTPD
jgi:hypothetical protein